MIHGNITQALRHLADGGSYRNGQTAGAEFLNIMQEFPLVCQKLGLGTQMVPSFSSWISDTY
jgi:hypothetical protein